MMSFVNGIWSYIVTEPFFGFRIPKIVRTSVLLPPPLGPTIPTNSPHVIDRDISRRIWLPDRLTERSLTFSISSPHTGKKSRPMSTTTD